MQTDQLGLEHTTDKSESIDMLMGVLDKYLGSRVDTMPALDELLAFDPDLPGAILFRAYLLKLAADPRFRNPINKCIEQLDTRDDLNERERHHLAALKQWHNDQLEDTVASFDTIVRDHPKDMLALRVAHYLHFYGSGGVQMLSSLDQVLDQWQPEDPFFGYLKGMQSFALEESGHYKDAEAAGREALEMNNADIWAAHAVTHVFQMQERFDEGVPFIESLAGNWDSANNFVNHMHWHKALQHIGQGEPGKALVIYDDLLVAPLADDFYLDVCNAASLLWRLTMLGVDVGDRWQELLEYSRNRVEDDELVFTTLHYLMAPVVLNDTDTTERGLSHFDKWASSATTQGEVCKQVGQTMARAIALFGTEQQDEGARLMSSVQKDIYRIGGSHAQRHLFDQLIDYYQ